jgi:peptidyl-tRNA hydrolase, PTH1 family
MKYLIAGLGNPGLEYELTRHNIGFLVVEKLAADIGISFSPKKLGDISQGRIKNKIVHLLKPATFMNLSGKAIRYWLQELDIPMENLLVITDDLALPTGKLRMKMKGSDGGHNGMKSIQDILQTQQYSRLRFGISNEFLKGSQVDYVLGNWSDDEWKIVKPKIEVAAEAVKSFVLAGPVITMEKYNGLD